jgi:hypothetical protein
MPSIYLTHPNHGTKVANMEAEANADIANGWVVFNPEKQAKNVEDVEDVEVVEEAEKEENALTTQVKRRRRN